MAIWQIWASFSSFRFSKTFCGASFYQISFLNFKLSQINCVYFDVATKNVAHVRLRLVHNRSTNVKIRNEWQMMLYHCCNLNIWTILIRFGDKGLIAISSLKKKLHHTAKFEFSFKINNDKFSLYFRWIFPFYLSVIKRWLWGIQ